MRANSAARTTAVRKRVFTERFPGYVRPWARKTLRVGDQICALGLALGGRGAQRLAPLLGVQVSDQTVLRFVVARSDPPTPDVTILGVDDFTFRRAGFPLLRQRMLSTSVLSL